jgi:hypothetical protein
LPSLLLFNFSSFSLRPMTMFFCLPLAAGNKQVGRRALTTAIRRSLP